MPRKVKPITIYFEFYEQNDLLDAFVPFLDFVIPNLDIKTDGVESPFFTQFTPGNVFGPDPTPYVLTVNHYTNFKDEILIDSFGWAEIGTESFGATFSRPLNTHLTEFAATGNNFFVNWDQDFKFRVIASDGGTVFIGGAKSDSFTGGFSDDEFRGDGGNDRALGLNGNDYLDGVDGNDILFGGTGKDFLLAGLGDDNLRGNEDTDVLVFSAGRDVGFGGDDKDVFLFMTETAGLTPSNKPHRTILKDYDGAEDLIVFQMETAPEITPDPESGTLKDLPRTIPGLMSWNAKRGDVILKVDGYTVVLKDTKPKDVLTSHIAFTDDLGIVDKLVDGSPVGIVAQTFRGTVDLDGPGSLAVTFGLSADLYPIFTTDVFSLGA